MNMKKLSTALLVLMGVVLLGTSSAQAIPNGSLILAFRLNNTGGTGTDLEVNLGTTFNFGLNQSSIVNLNTDLTNIYGSNWNTNANLVFSIIGENNNPSSNKPIYLSNPDNANTPFTTFSTSSIVGSVTGIYSPSGGSTGSATGSLVMPEGNGNSYYAVITATGSGQDYDFVPYSTEQFVSAGIASFDLNKVTGSNVTTDLGTFNLSGSGVVSFNTVAVPEPASYVLCGIAGVLFLIMRRRSRIQV